ncbi:kinase-like domain-containing protein [Dipodascopsis tothii]|uniref:kinase-like domain-containing protein n=1 Tax=Dipodascopsis tothii TaxID=44089 RepID=UPI0034CE751E
MSVSQYVLDLAYSLTSCVMCFPSPQVRINGRTYKMLRVLGEGGFSYVYLVQAAGSGELLALKKIRCPFGPESLQHVLREVDAYKTFAGSRYVIGMVDFAVVQESGSHGGGQKTVYVLLPYFRSGNLQDAINAHLVNRTAYDERELLELFAGIARGVQAMHRHRPGAGGGEERSRSLAPTTEASGLMAPSASRSPTRDADAGGSPYADAADSTMVPYAHRDIKPANIMLAENGRPMLMDLGSCVPARTRVTSRSQALEIQDVAAEHCTMPYRAPELFDVKTDTTLDEKVDIWSLGCTFFALMYNASPFELETADMGASLSLAVTSGRYRFPDSPLYSEATKDIVRGCLVVEPTARADIEDVIMRVETAQRALGA